MTESEALEILDNECQDPYKVQIALKVARLALKKQIPKKVIGIEAKLLNRYCPSCDAWAGVDLKKNMKYCPDCGQKLDWSEV